MRSNNMVHCANSSNCNFRNQAEGEASNSINQNQMLQPQRLNRGWSNECVEEKKIHGDVVSIASKSRVAHELMRHICLHEQRT